MPEKERSRRGRSPSSDDEGRKRQADDRKTTIKKEHGADSPDRRKRKASPSPVRGSKRSSPPPSKHSGGDRDSRRSKDSESRHTRDDDRSSSRRGPSPERRPQRKSPPPRSGGPDRSAASFVPHRKGNRHGDEEVDESKYEYGRKADEPPPDPKPAKPSAPKEQPNFELSGKLSEDQRKLADGTILKYQEPTEAALPTKRWRLYIFKGDETLEPIPLHRQSCYLFGRERKLADIPVDHPSCSKQHAVLQFRDIRWQNDMGDYKHEVRPYIMDLQSTNGVYLNKQRIDHSRYYELKEKDVLKFGFSTREYVLLHEQSLNA